MTKGIPRRTRFLIGVISAGRRKRRRTTLPTTLDGTWTVGKNVTKTDRHHHTSKVLFWNQLQLSDQIPDQSRTK